jgi:hypothetical protein
MSKAGEPRSQGQFPQTGVHGVRGGGGGGQAEYEYGTPLQNSKSAIKLLQAALATD